MLSVPRLGIPFVAGLTLYRIQRKKMRTNIERSLTTPLCIYCCFDLSDREHSGDDTFCTDCGNTTPIRLER
jgi:hypothetical protein